jgi:hypothetical protein
MAKRTGSSATKNGTTQPTKPNQPTRPAKSVSDWRIETLAEVRRLIRSADPNIVEERKWIKPTNPSGVPVWSHAGIVCTGETYKQVVKLTFARGASLDDPHGLFNSSLEGNARRAIDLREGEKLNAAAFKALVRAAVAENVRTSAAKTKSSANDKSKKGSVTKSKAKQSQPGASGAKPVKLLSGGNPQIAKGYCDEPVQAYLAAMPGWKSAVGRRLDAIIERAAPGVRKAVKWNSPIYGAADPEQGWFLGMHVFARYVKVAFFRGALLRPIPPGESKSKDVRYLNIHENDEIDEAQFADWVKQASQLPGERM